VSCPTCNDSHIIDPGLPVPCPDCVEPKWKAFADEMQNQSEVERLRAELKQVQAEAAAMREVLSLVWDFFADFRSWARDDDEAEKGPMRKGVERALFDGNAGRDLVERLERLERVERAAREFLESGFIDPYRHEIVRLRAALEGKP